MTPIKVPALSNTSMNRIENTTIRKVASNTLEKSSWNRVGAIDGGSDTTPVNFDRPSGMPTTATTRMPISVPPMLIGTLILFPIIIGYFVLVHWLFRGKVGESGYEH